ncbi:beta-propeller fold lactonase family protein [Longispora sp. NPDC051575]|uniref:YVTN family beta-propeller repeat protein n=1 Tax=Longispora sp. NPDC051575 TaxID=3154943 RepID=UPI00343E2B30
MAVAALAGCAQADPKPAAKPQPVPAPTATSASPTPAMDVLPGMPPPLTTADVYAASGSNKFSPAVAGARELVYVPHNGSHDVWVIDPKTYQVIDRFDAGREPQHVVPGYDMRTLYATADEIPGGTLTPIDPKTGRPGEVIHVQDPYNLYFTPDGKYAIVVAEAYKRLDFYEYPSWRPHKKLSVPECAGVNHMDFTADGKRALVTCEFANRMIVLDVATMEQVASFALDQVPNGMPQDSRLSPDGKRFYVADMHANGVYVFDGDATKQIGFIPTGQGAHAVYFSRDSKRMFVTNRGEGTIVVLDPVTGDKLGKWTIPGGGSPDMGALSADGTQFWVSGRYHNEVYVFDTTSGELLRRIPVGSGPHGLTYWPQPGRYSLGHTSNIR